MSKFSVWLDGVLGKPLGNAITTGVNTIADPIIASTETAAAATPIGAAIVGGIDALGGKTPGSPVVAAPTVASLAGLDPNLGNQIESAVNTALTAVGVPAADFKTFDDAVITALEAQGVNIPAPTS